jgi:hypothetical protein
LAELGLDQHMRLTLKDGAPNRSDIERSVRPSRLRQVLDNTGNVAGALDQ